MIIKSLVGRCMFVAKITYLNRVVHSSHFWVIFDSFLASFSDHFYCLAEKRLKNEIKMVTVNVPKRKHLENEAKMHFAWTSAVLSTLHSPIRSDPTSSDQFCSESTQICSESDQICSEMYLVIKSISIIIIIIIK